MKRNCRFCGKEFETNSNNQYYCTDIHYVECPICGNKREVNDSYKLTQILKTGPTCCSYACRAKKTKLTSLKKYGCEAPGNNPEARKKARDTMIARLGVPYAMMSEDIRNKSKESMVSKYGVENAAKSSVLVEKRMKTNRDRYGAILPFNTPECYEKQHETMMKRYGVMYAIELPQVTNWTGHVSKINQKFNKRVVDMGLVTKYEKFLDGKYFDIEIDTANILLEINPTYTHSSCDHYNMQGLYPYYHRDKTLLAEKHGYRCIHVWDWDDWTKVLDLVRPTERKIFARKCDVYRINKNVGDEFLNMYHLQGTCRGQLLYLGLVYENELVELMTFGKSRYDKHYYIELMRLCSKPGTVIVGGASRLFSYATSEYGLSSIISYCDRSKFTGDVYEKMGMQFKRVTPPQEIWSKSTQHITANLLRARGYDQLFGTDYGKGTSNEELMLKNGWLPVYDCGQRVYVFE